VTNSAARRAADRPRGPLSARGHVRIWLALVVGVVVVGSLGFVVLGWPVGDAAYMTVITLTTVGFREVRDLDGLGRAWTMLLAVAGVGIIFGTIGIVAESVLIEAASGRREQRRMVESVKALRDHFILCGYGRVGRTVARELEHAGIPFVVIDINSSSIAEAAADGFLVVEGDGTQDAILMEAGILEGRGLITTVDSDANNVYVTLSARSLNPRLFIVARANLEGSEAKLLQAGADRAVSPYTRAGRQIAELATRPRVADFIDYALSHGELAFSMEEVEVAADGPLAGRTVGSLVAEGIHPLAIVRGPRDYEPNPPADRVLAAGDGLIVSGTSDTLRRLRERA
jgi:voltage-gated potassium channel